MTPMLEQLVAARHCGHTWPEIMEHTGLTPGKSRIPYYRAMKKGLYQEGDMPCPCPICTDAVGSTSFEETGNTATLRATLADPGNIHDLDTLLELCRVDLSTWRVLDWGVKQWAVGAKDKQGQLNWEDGKIVDGHLSYNGVSVTPLWSVWAKFVRIVPVPVCPVVQPMLSVVTPIVAPPVANGGLKTCLIGADGHFGYKRCGRLVPFHNRRMVHAFLQIAHFIQPDVIVLDGDWTDAAELSDKFLRLPDMTQMLQPTIAEGHWVRHQLRTLCPKSKIYELEANHEERAVRYLVSRAPAFYDLKAANCEVAALSWENLLGLSQLGIEWLAGYPDNGLWLTDFLMIMHGNVVSNVPGGTARKILEKFEDVKTVSGHIHRRERANQTRKRRNGRVMGEAVVVGTFADLEGPIPAQTNDFNWQNSFGVVYYSDDDAEIHDVGVSQDGIAFWQGLRFEGEDYVGQLRADLPDFRW